MTTKNPNVTVLMTIYNGMPHLRATIDSILEQTYVDFEFLIVNDGSPDSSRNCVAACNDSRIRLVDNPENIGQTASLNKGIGMARGRFIARIDQDDLAHPQRLQKQVDYFEEHPAVVLLGCNARLIDIDGRLCDSGPSVITTSTALKWALLFDNPFFHSSVMFRTDPVRDEFSGYDTQFVISQDFDLWSRIAQRYEVANLAESLIDYRVHETSTFNKFLAQSAKDMHKVICSNLERTLQLPITLEWEEFVSVFLSYEPLEDFGVSDVLKCLEQIQQRFFELHDNCADDIEIKRYTSYVYRKIADIYASRRFASIQLWREAQTLDRQFIDDDHTLMRLSMLWAGGAELRKLKRWIATRKRTAEI